MDINNQISIIIPAFFVCSGIAVCAAVQFGLAGIVGERSTLYQALSAACLAIAGYLYTTAEYYSARSVPAGGSPVALAVRVFHRVCSFVRLVCIGLYRAEANQSLADPRWSSLCDKPDRQLCFSLQYEVLDSASGRADDTAVGGKSRWVLR